jgi:hypothetical protein
VKRFLEIVLAATRGISGNQTQRRRAMAALLVVTLAMLALGIFPLWGVLTGHPFAFAIYWLVCAWLTICVLLLAMYDFLMVLRRGREERDAIRKRIFEDPD